MRKKKFNLKWLIPIVVILILSYLALALFWNPMPKTVKFELNLESKTNFSTEHFSFFINEVEYDNSINEVTDFIITTKGKINLSEQPLVSFDPKDLSQDIIEGREEIPFNSLMKFVLEKENNLPIKIYRNKYLRQLKPTFFQSSQVKAMLLTVDNRQMLEITAEDEKYLLLLRLDHEITAEYAQDIIETVRYRAD